MVVGSISDETASVIGYISPGAEVVGYLSNDGNEVIGEISIAAAQYQGSYIVTPTEETQTLPTAGEVLSSDVIINPIPSNYGLITWSGSGSVIMVS